MIVHLSCSSPDLIPYFVFPDQIHSLPDSRNDNDFFGSELIQGIVSSQIIDDFTKRCLSADFHVLVLIHEISFFHNDKNITDRSETCKILCTQLFKLIGGYELIQDITKRHICADFRLPEIPD